ncbi:50S ribosomal protein L11 methyltransferase [Mesorhizobium xinjiangense]|uniref:50S ribosomal protein L11 methyltransferase n=1 Tax=Mesorhizobium xinjiangense TaxID=2678685 RepID=UPI0012ED5923|nr:50S ribosomal protein L11 methyltransferase [Mesorhizobium xinjiangense]
MSLSRLFATAPREKAMRAYALFEALFEDDGFALAITEIDEANDILCVEIYVDGDAAGVVSRARNALDEAGLSLPIENEPLPDIDWVSKSLEGLKPVRAGRFLVHGAHDRDKRATGDLAIEIEAGQAFGTGHHGTTAGCLEMIEQIVRREHPVNALDMGTGSAVLAIALARLAHIPVLATDIDPVATRVARDNVRLNAASAWVRAVTATGFDHPEIARRAPYDLIIANILARPLMGLASAMARHIASGGSLILSGILERQRNAVIAAYAGQRFRHVRTIQRGEWVTIHMKR